MTEFNHSPERDEEVFAAIQETIKYLPEMWRDEDGELILELLAIAKKWRAKANMRAARIEELEKDVKVFQDRENGVYR